MKEDFHKSDMVQFFDEMNILKSEKQERLKAAETMYGLIGVFFKGVYRDILDGRFLHEKFDNDYIDDLIALYDEFLEIVAPELLYESDMIQKARQFAEQVHNTNKKVVIGQKDIEFQNAVLFGIPIEETPEPVEERFLGYTDATRIGEDQSNFIHNYRHHMDLVKNGRLTHTWDTMKDEAVRPLHAMAQGQTVPIDAPFIIGGYKMMYPGDTLTDNPPGDLTICCRCVEI